MRKKIANYSVEMKDLQVSTIFGRSLDGAFGADRDGSARVPRRILFWTKADLETKLLDFQHYYNGHRTHAGLEGRLPEPAVAGSVLPIGIHAYQWLRHCRASLQIIRSICNH
jgi:hypothetical protein